MLISSGFHKDRDFGERVPLKIFYVSWKHVYSFSVEIYKFIFWIIYILQKVKGLVFFLSLFLEISEMDARYFLWVISWVKNNWCCTVIGYYSKIKWWGEEKLYRLVWVALLHPLAVEGQVFWTTTSNTFTGSVAYRLSLEQPWYSLYT